MADNLPDQIENQLLDALVGAASYTVTTPIKLALVTANGSDSAAGTEVTGGSYARQSITWSAAASGEIHNDTTINFTNMPTATVVGIEVYDSNATPKRLAYGALTSSKSVSSGDTLQFASSAISLTLS